MNTSITYVCKYCKRGIVQTMTINNYYLGLMWCVGTLDEGRTMYRLQSFEPDKVYIMEQLRNIVLADITTNIRRHRGTEREIKILRFSDGVYAERLRELGYDNPEIEYPTNFKNIEFICACLECRLKKANTNSKTVLFNVCITNVDQWNNLVGDYLTSSKPPVLHYKDRNDYRIYYTKDEIKKCAQIMLLQDCSNKDFWKGILEAYEK